MKILEERVNEYRHNYIERTIKEGRTPSIGISRKQANVVYVCNKQGKINVSNEVVSQVYCAADATYKKDYYQRNSEEVDRIVLAIQAIFDNEYEIAQYLLVKGE